VQSYGGESDALLVNGLGTSETPTPETLMSIFALIYKSISFFPIFISIAIVRHRCLTQTVDY
jgi:hypothetical protein